MKKIFTLVLSSLFVVAAMAADRRPTVTIQSGKNYQIVIDGKSFSTSFGGSMTVPYLSQGYHTIQVYSSMGRTFFMGRRSRMLDQSSFVLRNNDINIRIDMFGNISVKELKGGWDRDDHDRGRNDRDNNWNRDDQGRDRQHKNF